MTSQHQNRSGMAGNKRGRTKEIHKKLQDLDLEGSPHKERDLIGEDVDLDLLSLFPQKDARIIGGRGSRASFRRSTMGGKNELKRWGTIGEEGPLNRPPRNPTVMCIFAFWRYYL